MLISMHQPCKQISDTEYFICNDDFGVAKGDCRLWQNLEASNCSFRKEAVVHETHSSIIQSAAVCSIYFSKQKEYCQ